MWNKCDLSAFVKYFKNFNLAEAIWWLFYKAFINAALYVVYIMIANRTLQGTFSSTSHSNSTLKHKLSDIHQKKVSHIAYKTTGWLSLTES